MRELIEDHIFKLTSDKALWSIAEKVLEDKRLSPEEALHLFRSRELSLIGILAEFRNRLKNGEKAYFIVNVQINPTNICIYRCPFCAFGVSKGDPTAYEMDLEQILNKIEKVYRVGGREVHMVGGVPPHWTYEKYISTVRRIKESFPDIYIKAWTAVEIHRLTFISKKTYREVLTDLKEAGVSVLPGGGAEIFSERVRKIIAPHKAKAEEYLEIHRTAHMLGIPTNATMLYGHVETYEERVDHLLKLRTLQDETGGFQVFIPLPYWPNGTRLGGKRTSSVDDLKTIAISRLFLDNFEHIKAYWVALGERTAEIALNFGADDLDGTLEEEKIIHSAGAESAYGHSVNKLIKLIKNAGKIPVERNTLYESLRTVE